MNIKQISFSIFLFVATTAFSTENIDPWKPVVFTSGNKAMTRKDKTAIFKKIPGSKYNFNIVEYDNFEQYINKPCVFCPFISSIIVDSDNPDHCDSLAIGLLSARVTALEEHNKNMIKIMKQQSKINQDQHEFNQDQHEFNQRQHTFNQHQHTFNQHQHKFNQHQHKFNQHQHKFNQHQHKFNQE